MDEEKYREIILKHRKEYEDEWLNGLHKKILKNNYELLPDKAKEIVWEHLSLCFLKNRPNVAERYFYVYSMDASKCESPIEQIFLTAFEWIDCWEHYDTTETEESFILEPQHKVNVDGKNFILDFAFFDEHDLGNGESEFVKIAIECDGHEFHEKTKEQVNARNKRDILLQSDGWEILRFSGNEIYNHPGECAKMAYRFIERKQDKYLPPSYF